MGPDHGFNPRLALCGMGHWGAVLNSTVCLAVLMQLTVTTVQSGKQTLSEALADAGQRFSGEVIIKFQTQEEALEDMYYAGCALDSGCSVFVGKIIKSLGAGVTVTSRVWGAGIWRLPCWLMVTGKTGHINSHCHPPPPSQRGDTDPAELSRANLQEVKSFF